MATFYLFPTVDGRETNPNDRTLDRLFWETKLMLTVCPGPSAGTPARVSKQIDHRGREN